MVMPEAARRWTRQMVFALPDDRNRYELINGELIVTPSPAPPHQLLVAGLFASLQPYLTRTGAGLILCSPADLAFGEGEILQPDLFVLPAPVPGPLTSWREVTALLLAIEVLSPATARWDRGLKRRRYQRARVAEYWIVDPDARVVERWRPADTRPEIVDVVLEWRPDADIEPLRIELTALFTQVLGTP